MIKFGIRQSFDRIDQIEERYANINVPVEVALPYYWDIYEPVRAHLGETAGKIKSYGTQVLSVHAVQSPITDKRFKVWGKEMSEFAKTLGAMTITLHPNNVNKDQAVQDEALKNLEYFTGLDKNDAVFCIETFEGKRRVFTPDEIVSCNLPMTLDTSHIRDDEKVWSLLKGYKERILNVHLSAREGGKQHLPIDDFCKDVVRYLIDSKWNGNVILEYLFEYHDQMLKDLELLKAMR
ncbi:MAG: sugar phosphate isomerase/epimerase [Candidatus Omnitrophica bacterium]|nr:sugar phosphate isomerase/epimerase [Candidatus Omnitrophota bacterium]MBU4477549.1 sugar phosphate isomerase/epimerase [Candidatus Omnitrophota bacterium]MCG2703577.1 sugar phosphate isomerase/epimerase [Candidatus Omnitrophota bacterium]